MFASANDNRSKVLVFDGASNTFGSFVDSIWVSHKVFSADELEDEFHTITIEEAEVWIRKAHSTIPS